LQHAIEHVQPGGRSRELAGEKAMTP